MQRNDHMDVIDLPGRVREILGSLKASEHEIFEDEASIGNGEVIIRRAFPRNSAVHHRINTIPWGTPGSCQEILLVAIGSNPSENVEFRLLQAVEHIWPKCGAINKYVIFWAGLWDAQAWKRHSSSFKNVTAILKIFGAAPTMLS